VVDSLSCTILNNATKRLKESDLVVTQPNVYIYMQENIVKMLL